MRNVAIFCATVLVLLGLATVTLLVLSPFEYRVACQFQMAVGEFFGFRDSLHYWPTYEDDEFTGTARVWDKWGVLRMESSYLNGLRHGFWREFTEDGSLESICEYRNGRPWNGVCQFHEEKAWRGEYRNGKPYNGVYYNDDCYIDGKLVSADEFMERHKLDAKYKEYLYGIDIFTDAQQTMQPTPTVAPNSP